MKFGKLPQSELDHVDFSILKSKYSQKRGGDSSFTIYIGAPKWAVKEWVGTVYPPKTPVRLFLSEYSKVFNSIELNATFYKMPTPKLITGWREQVSSEVFKFCPKIPNTISHYRKLYDVDDLVDEFLLAVDNFENHLGTIFLQLHENFGINGVDNVKRFVERFPKKYSLALELRHPSWFSESHDLFDFFSEYSISAIQIDVSGRRDILHMHVTAPTQFIRFVGNELHESDYSRIDEWVDVLGGWKKNGVSEVYFFFHQPGELTVPEIRDYLIEKCQDKLRVKFFETRFRSEEESLSLFS